MPTISGIFNGRELPKYTVALLKQKTKVVKAMVKYILQTALTKNRLLAEINPAIITSDVPD